MVLNKVKLMKLSSNNGWTQNELARQMQISKGTLSKVLHGKRGAGRKVVAGLLRIFPDEGIDTLFSNVNTNKERGIVDGY